MKVRAIAVGLSAAALALPVGSAAGSSSAAQSLSAAMTPQQVVTPKSKPWPVPAAVKSAKGAFTGTVSSDGKKLNWKISYSGIGKPTLAIADIHYGKKGQFGPILVRLCGPCKSGTSGVVKLKAGSATQFSSGNAWVTIITTKYANGIVRGQIRAR